MSKGSEGTKGSKGKKLIGIIRNNLLVRRDSNRPENEVPDTVSTLEDIASQVRKEAAENPQISAVKEFFTQTDRPEKKVREKAVAAMKKVEEAAAKPKKSRKKRQTKLTAVQFEELIEKDCTVLEIVGQVMDRNVEIRSQLKTSPT